MPEIPLDIIEKIKKRFRSAVKLLRAYVQNPPHSLTDNAATNTLRVTLPGD